MAGIEKLLRLEEGLSPTVDPPSNRARPGGGVAWVVWPMAWLRTQRLGAGLGNLISLA